MSAGYPVEFSPTKNVAWKASAPYGQSSPVVMGTRLYGAASGSPNALGEYYASHLAADGKAFLANTEGKITVLKAGAEWAAKMHSLDAFHSQRTAQQV